MLIENLLIYCRPSYEDSEGRKILHAFPLPKESEQYSAQSWSGWDKSDSKATLIEYTEEDKKFPEFTGIELYDLDKRYNGGRAYQVLIPMNDAENHWLRCDLREDALMETMLTQGVGQGGKLNGSFTFVRDGAQTNLVLVGSKDYEKHKAQTDKKKSKRKIKVADLKIGHVYSTEQTSKVVYLGAYYQNEKTTFEGQSSFGNTKTFHMFMKTDSHYKGIDRFVFKKVVNFSYESQSPIFSKDNCEKLVEEYTSESITEMNNTIKSIEESYLKWYQHYLKQSGGRTYDKHTYENKARKEVYTLVNWTFELYRNSITNKNKDAVLMDKDYIKTLCSEAKQKGLESIKDFDFLNNF